MVNKIVLEYIKKLDLDLKDIYNLKTSWNLNILNYSIVEA